MVRHLLKKSSKLAHAGFLVLLLFLLTLSSPINVSSQGTSPSSVRFDGVNDIIRTVNLPLSSQFTLEAWVKRTNDAATYQSFLSDANTSYSQAVLSLYVDAANQDCGPTDQFAFYQASGNSTHCSGITADLNTWHHIAISRDSSGTRRFFVDGLLRSNQANSPAPTDSSGLFTLGRAGDYNGEYFAGLIDEVRLSNTAIYTGNFSVPTLPLSSSPNTVGLWHLDEGAGQVAADSSGNGRNGILGTGSSADVADPTWSADSPVGAGLTSTGASEPTPTISASPTPSLTPYRHLQLQTRHSQPIPQHLFQLIPQHQPLHPL